MSIAHNIPNLNTFVFIHPIRAKLYVQLNQQTLFMKLKISSKIDTCKLVTIVVDDSPE